mmetsp:Transcript_57061/g.107495  ORF Transcript_57061/g.107495 Transcript_57061/m.107495 type:complete len:420 (-) Transcript_57061:197-1456(-)
MLFTPKGRSDFAQPPEETAARLIGRGDVELARTLTSAATRPEDRSSMLWLLVRGFHKVSHRLQCELVLRTIRGFAELPPSEQAQVVESVAPRIRVARAGWQEAAERHLASKEHGQDEWLYPLVGTIGRSKADVEVVELLDSIEAALRRLQQHERRRLHRRLDQGVSEAFKARVFARLLSELPHEEVVALETWLVDEGALTADAARQLFGALTQAAVAGGTVLGVGEKFADDANALWADLAEDFVKTGVDEFWPQWLQGHSSSSTSPRGQEDPAQRFKVVSTVAVAAARANAAEGRRSSGGGGSAGPAASGENSSAAGLPGELGRPSRRSSVQLHCPAQTFLWSGEAAPSKEPAKQPARATVSSAVSDFLGGNASKASEAQTETPPDESADEGSTAPSSAPALRAQSVGSTISLGKQFGL